MRRHSYPGIATSHQRMTNDGDNEQQRLREEASALLSKARQLRLEIGEKESSTKTTVSRNTTPGREPKATSSPWQVQIEEEGVGYRLYIDIGREDGTWMDRRWGASGRRIPFSIDVKFLTRFASESEADKMVKDNFGGKSSQTCVMASAKAARLREGFDMMNCHGGAYRIDAAAGGKYTVRFYLEVDGTKDDQDYG